MRGFSGAARTTRAGSSFKDLGINVKRNMKQVETKVVQINDAVVTASQQATMRQKNASAVVKERVKEIPNKLADKAIDAAKVVDETFTNTKTIFNPKTEFAFDGGVVKRSADNTHVVESTMRKILLSLILTLVLVGRTTIITGK
ncbi:hypothetical protein [Sporosarcina pasteurii]|uniref:hypothetical protein n=1 Tax=Sporosarcina pasteurii TaxID=1474 RepID=UPI0010679733|nr:hypothetical protein [Sporosarcina pasteurii]MDS9473267.1 hypothetical protein [Sporosarcina pasteurii]QBQ06500.1 hypothetical protein E2C16_12955 [Sporosarcina pasteurii]